MMLLLPSDVVRPRRVDEHFVPEAGAAREAGWDVALVDHDALASPEGADRAAFIPDLADAEQAWAVASRFRTLRGEDMVGGFVLRRFESFVGAEVRTWWVDGTCRLVGPHPDTPDEPPPADLDLISLAPLVRGLRLPFVTLDLVRRNDGAWRVVELGDGQVSDRPPTTPPDALITALTPDSTQST